MINSPNHSPMLHTLSWRQGLSYGLLGLPLAFAALPLYVALPHHYASQLGLSLAAVGGLIMLVRLLDAALEPLIGLACDRLFARSVRSVLLVGAVCAALQGLGMTGLFFPLVNGSAALSLWLVALMFLTCVAHSQLLILHQAWGVRLGGDDAQRSRIVAWREGHALVGVVAASAFTVAFGPGVMLGVFAGALVVGWRLWSKAPSPPELQAVSTRTEPTEMIDVHQPVPTLRMRLLRPLRVGDFRRLLAVYLVNGIASAVPAALMMFFAKDRLGADERQIAGFLIVYFVSGALGLPLWLKLIRRIGLARSWLVGMLLAVVCFGWTASLEQGQHWAFAGICLLTGFALGADLSIPIALLARLIERQGDQGSNDGAYLGWWNLASKLNLAIAAGLALPLLQWGGYAPGSQDPQALERLAWAYALLPCLLKLIGAGLLFLLLIKPSAPSIHWRTSA